MNKAIFIFLIISLLAIQGCSLPHVDSVKKDYEFDSNSPNALLIGSITFDGYYAKYSIVIKNTKTNEVYRVKAADEMTPFHLFNDETNLEHLGVTGDLYAIELKPGEYELYDWSVKPGNGTYLYPTKKFRIKINLKPGHALYLGSVHFKQTETFGVTISGAQVYLYSEDERDLSEFRKNYANVNPNLIEIGLKKDQRISLGGALRPDSDIIMQAIGTGLSMPTP